VFIVDAAIELAVHICPKAEQVVALTATVKLSGGEGVKRMCTNLWGPIHCSVVLCGKNVT
jgi:hypothetical protein